MNAAVNSFQSNFAMEKKPVDFVQKDVKKWVDSVVEFKANFDKKKDEPSPNNSSKKSKKIKIKKKSSPMPPPTDDSKAPSPVQHKHANLKKPRKSERSPANDSNASPDSFERIKETYRTIKLPPNWTSGISGGKIVFNRIKLSTLNAQQKMVVERSLVITKDCKTHVLVNGSEILLSNWEMQKVDTIEDIKKAIKDVEALRLCDGSVNGSKSPQCFLFVDSQHKTCPACKVNALDNPKTETKGQPGKKKSDAKKRKAATKQKSQQK